MLSDLKPVPRVSLSDGIVQQLTELIRRRVLKPGDRIPTEKLLCQQFNVGRTSVREALRTLAAMGIVESHAGDGTFVSAPGNRQLERSFAFGILLDEKTVEDLVETRLLLEGQTAYLAAQKAVPEDLEEMSGAVKGMEESQEKPEAYLRHDLQFHLAIAQAAHNSILQSLLCTTRGYLEHWIQEALSSSRDRAGLSVAQHKKILRAIRKQDGEQARRAMTEHLLSSSADFRSRTLRASY